MRIGNGLVIAVGLAALVAAPAIAQDTRQLGAHVHGESHLTIAVEGNKVSMELHAPGADLVGFEYIATTPAQKAAVAAATATLKDPIGLFGFPAAANCKVATADVKVAEEEEDEDEKADAGKAPGAAPATPAAPAAKHAEFQVTYEMTCSNLGAISGLNFAFFSKFPNAAEVHVDLISGKGAFSLDAKKASPAVSTRNMF